MRVVIGYKKKHKNHVPTFILKRSKDGTICYNKVTGTKKSKYKRDRRKKKY